MRQRNLKRWAACLALLCTQAHAGPDGGLPPSARVLAARLALPDGGLVDTEEGYYLSPDQGAAVARELAYLRAEKEALEAKASEPTPWIVTALVAGVVVGVACGYAAGRVTR